MARKTLHTISGVFTLPRQAQVVLNYVLLNNTAVKTLEVKRENDRILVVGWSERKTIVDVVEIKMEKIAMDRFFNFRNQSKQQRKPMNELNRELAERSLVKHARSSRR